MKAVALVALASYALLAVCHCCWMTETHGGYPQDDLTFDVIVAPGSVIEKVAEGLVWAEGPVWDAADRSLLFSDVPRNAIFRWRPDAGVALFLERSGYSGDEPFTGREPGSNGLTFDRDGPPRVLPARRSARGPAGRRTAASPCSRIAFRASA